MAEINITPFTDVILVLLIIFMITTPLISQATIQIKLPEVANSRPAENADRVDITIIESGAIYLGKEAVSDKVLRDRVSWMHRNNPDLNVFLRADKSVKFKHIVKILDILTELEVKKLNISAVLAERPR